MPQAKLTLSINPDIIAAAKVAAANDNLSLSQLIERYLSRIIEKPIVKSKTPIVDSLIGAANPKGEKINADKLRYEYLKKKYNL